MQELAIKTAGTRRHAPDFRNQAVSHTGLLHALSPIRVGLIGLDIKFITRSSCLDGHLVALATVLERVEQPTLCNFKHWPQVGLDLWNIADWYVAPMCP